MSLKSARVSAQIAVADEARAREFYGGKLGLAPTEEGVEGSWTYRCADGTSLHLYVAPDNAGRATGTVARFDVASVERVVDELRAAGVAFESYDAPIATDERGIHDTGYGKVAWFRDPDGTTFAIEEVPSD